VGVLREELHVATFENVVTISRPIEDVFRFLSDFENVPKWNYAIVETGKVSEGAVGVGTIYRQVRSVPSRSEERFEVTAFEAPRYLEIRGQLGPFPSRLSYALEATPQGTRVTNLVELELRGPGRLLGRVAVPRVRDAVGANLQKAQATTRRRLSGGAHRGHGPTAAIGQRGIPSASKWPGRPPCTTPRRWS
jgi:uncharacterized protein YndB with AHSA1/START domain